MHRYWWILAILIALLAAGCRPQATPQAAQGDITIQLRAEPEALAVGEATLMIRVEDANGDPITDARVSARGDMNHAGMVPVLADASSIEGDEYVIPFEWTMGGDWIVEVTVELADGTTVSDSFDLSVSGEMSGMDMESMDMDADATEAMDMGEHGDMSGMGDATEDAMEMDMSEGTETP